MWCGAAGIMPHLSAPQLTVYIGAIPAQGHGSRARIRTNQCVRTQKCIPMSYILLLSVL